MPYTCEAEENQDLYSLPFHFHYLTHLHYEIYRNFLGCKNSKTSLDFFIYFSFFLLKT